MPASVLGLQNKAYAYVFVKNWACDSKFMGLRCTKDILWGTFIKLYTGPANINLTVLQEDNIFGNSKS